MDSSIVVGSKKTQFIILVFTGFLIRLIYSHLSSGLSFPDEHRFYNDILFFSENLYLPQSFQDMPFLTVFFGSLVHYFQISEFGLITINICFSTITIILIYKITFAIDQNEWAALIAMTIATFYPFFIYYSSLLLSETIFITFLIAGFYYIFIDKPIQFSLFFAFAHLTRPTLIYFFPVLLIYYYFVFYHNHNKILGIKRVVVASSVFLIFISPWIIRNYQVYDTVLLTKPSGHQLWEGNNPWNKSGGVSDEDWQYLSRIPANLTFMEQNNWEKKQALDFIKQNPVTFLQLAIKKFIRFWHIWPNANPYNSGFYKWIAILSFGPVLLLSLSSMWVFRNDWRLINLLWIFVCYYTVIHMITIGSIRYRLPLEPFLISMAGAVSGKLLKRRRNRKKHC
jgi:hypothetical protein